MQEEFGTRFDLTNAFHLQIDGQSECMIRTLEDMLKACAVDFSRSWDSHLSFVEFAYNNSYHSSIEMTPNREV